MQKIKDFSSYLDEVETLDELEYEDVDTELDVEYDEELKFKVYIIGFYTCQ